MRVGYSMMREISVKSDALAASDYGMKEYEYEKMVKFLEKQGYIERVLRNGYAFSLKPAKLTAKGIAFIQEHAYLEEHYPLDRSQLKEWVYIDKKRYSNEAE